MADPVLTDVKSFRFKEMDLAGNLVSWNDRIGMRLAVHTYLKRDGAEIEPMGAEPGRFTMRLCFLGPEWAKNYRALVASIRKDPRGAMVHPILGSLRVACEGIPDAAVNPGSERDSINFTLAFVEDSVDATAVSEGFVGPAARQGQVSDLAAQVTAITSTIGFGAAAASAFASLTGAAVSFAAAAVAAAKSDEPDPSLDQQLADVAGRTDAALAAIHDDPAVPTDGQAYEALSLCERLYAATIALANAIAAAKPTLISYVVPHDTNVAALAATLYGKDGLGRIGELMTLNRIPNPQAIPSGTLLRLASPTL